MLKNNIFAIRLLLFIVFAVFVGLFAFDQYDHVREIVRNLCLSCLGID